MHFHDNRLWTHCLSLIIVVNELSFECQEINQIKSRELLRRFNLIL